MVNTRSSVTSLPLALIVLSSFGSVTADELPAVTESLVIGGNDSVPPGSGFSLVVDPSDSEVIYVVVGQSGILKSTDDGQTWNAVNSGLSTFRVSAIAIDPNDTDHLLIGFGGNHTAQGSPPYRSVDAGGRWEPTNVCQQQIGAENFLNIPQLHDGSSIAFDPSDSSSVFYSIHTQVGYCGGIYHSCDGALTFDKNPRCHTSVPRATCAPSTPVPDDDFFVQSNDISLIDYVPGSPGEFFAVNTVHATEGGGATTYSDNAVEYGFRDVIDTRGTFVPDAEEGVGSLMLRAFDIDSSGAGRFGITYGGIGERCLDGKAYIASGAGMCATADRDSHPAHLVVRWDSSETSGNVDCVGANDCDGDNAPDRIWRPIYQISGVGWGVYAATPNRVFVSNWVDQVVMLTPGSPGQPWDSKVVYDGPGTRYTRVFGDPNTTDRVYALSGGDAGFTVTRIETSDNWATDTDTVLLDIPPEEFIRSHHLAFVQRGFVNRLYSGNSKGLWGRDLDSGAGWDLTKTQYGAAVLSAQSPTEPDFNVLTKYPRLLLRYLGTPSAEENVDDTFQREDVMCTNAFHDIAFHPVVPGEIYAATSAGVWMNTRADVSVPGGTQHHPDIVDTSHDWTLFADSSSGLPQDFAWFVRFDPTDSSGDTLLVGLRNGRVAESADGGQSWGLTGTNLTAGQLASLVDAKDIAFLGQTQLLATSLGVLTRTKGGDWSLSLSTSGPVEDLAVGATGDSRVYAASTDGVHRSVDKGANWVLLDLEEVSPPFVDVEETVDRAGTHALWLGTDSRGIWTVQSAVALSPGTAFDSIDLQWPVLGGTFAQRLWYGADPDSLVGTGATEGSSPISLGTSGSTTLSGLGFSQADVFVAIQARDASGTWGPVGLPTRIGGYTLSPQLAVSISGDCESPSLTWSAVPGAKFYRIYRSYTGVQGPYSLLAERPNATISFTDDTAASSGELAYFVTTRFLTNETSGGNVVSLEQTCPDCPLTTAECPSHCVLDDTYELSAPVVEEFAKCALPDSTMFGCSLGEVVALSHESCEAECCTEDPACVCPVGCDAGTKFLTCTTE